MNVLVTGGSGRIGRYVVAELAAAGHVVTNVDLTPAPTLPGRFLRADLTDAGEVYGALAYAEAQAVVHLGAWPNAGMVPNPRTYGDNVCGAYNMFQACADLGIRRIVYASSAQIYGFAGAPPVFAPVSEDHPLRPVNSYALSKCAAEQAAAYFIRMRGLEIVSFRFMGVRMPSEIGPEIDAMAANPADGSSLLWTRTDARDAATACRLALETPGLEPGPYNITGAEVVLSRSTGDLVATYFGDATARRSELADRRSPLSTARAATAFGYRPRFVWSETQRHPESA